MNIQYIILMCVNTYFLKKKRNSIGCQHNMIIVVKKRKAMINNEYTIKQYIILICINTYMLNKRDAVYDVIIM